MKIFTVFLLFVILISCTNAQYKPENKDVSITKDETSYLDSLTLQERTKFRCSRVTVGNGDSLKFISGEGTVPLLIIIPNADLLFSNYDTLKNKNYNTAYSLNGINFLSIYLDESHRDSDLLPIKSHEKKKDKSKYYYPYSVYSKQLNEMAELKSSPEIIVDP